MNVILVTGIAAALAGVTAAFLMLPPAVAHAPDLAEARAMIASFGDALRRTPPPRLGVLSSIGSEKPVKVGLIKSTQLLEVGLRDLAFLKAFVRAGSFLENYAFSVHTAGTPTYRRYPMVASEDVRREVARLLTTDWTEDRSIELGSRFSADEIAGAVSSVLARAGASALHSARALADRAARRRHDLCVRGDAGDLQQRLDRFRCAPARNPWTPRAVLLSSSPEHFIADPD